MDEVNIPINLPATYTRSCIKPTEIPYNKNLIMTRFGLLDKRYLGSPFQDTEKWSKLMSEVLRDWFKIHQNIGRG